MLRGMRPFFTGFGVAVCSGLIVFVAALLLWPSMVNQLVSSNGFEPHGGCYLWEPGLLWLHGSSDFMIGAAYVVISATLAYFVHRVRRDIPFQWIILAFGAFIVACGATHFMEVWTLWTATYWLSGGLKVVTAVASVATAIALPPLVPKTIKLIAVAKLSEERQSRLEIANQELATLNEKLKEVDQLKTQFFANVSHELRTPLTLILGPTQNLLRTAQGLSEDQRRDLEVVERNARILLRHVNDLLDVARLEASKMEANYSEVDLTQLVRLTASYFESLVEEKHLSFIVETPPTLPAEIDAEKLQRVFLNLLSNAFKFTPAGGTIRYSLQTAQEQAIITVADSGPGIRPELREVIFERFRQGDGGATRHHSGTGLGLAIAKEFVELNNGTIGVSSATEGGASFRLEIPLKAPAGVTLYEAQPLSQTISVQQEITRQTLEELQKPALTAPGASTSIKAEQPLVLVVEDNLEMSRFISHALAEEYQVATAFDGQEGLEKALELVPDLILSDVMMPRLSGDQLVHEIRSFPKLAAVPIVLLSAKANEELRVQMLREGAQDYLLKPFSVEELGARISNLVAMKRTREILQGELTSQSQNLTDLAHQLADRNQELKKALNSRDEFLSVAAHELKTPVTSLRGFAQLIINQFDKNETVDPKRLRRALQIIDQQSEKLTRLSSQLLDVTRLEAGRMSLQREWVDLTRLVQEVVATLQVNDRAKNHTISFQAIDPVQAWIDPIRFEQVVINLLDNAIKYNPEGGPVEVELTSDKKEAAAQTIRLAVTDHGIGIPPENRPYIFDRFYQVQSQAYYGGMGLGLYISRQIIELHGGQIEAEFPVDGGTRFVIILASHSESDSGNVHPISYNNNDATPKGG